MNDGQPALDGPILVPVDFTPHAVAAAEWAAKAADRFRVPLFVLHVVHDPGHGPGLYRQVDAHGHVRSLREAARERLDEFMEELRQIPDFAALEDVEEGLVVGIPATRILEVADRIGAGLIVMGSRGRTGLDRLLLGSKAQRVVQLAKVPVTIVKAPDETQPD